MLFHLFKWYSHSAAISESKAVFFNTVRFLHDVIRQVIPETFLLCWRKTPATEGSCRSGSLHTKLR